MAIIVDFRVWGALDHVVRNLRALLSKEVTERPATAMTGRARRILRGRGRASFSWKGEELGHGTSSFVRGRETDGAPKEGSDGSEIGMYMVFGSTSEPVGRLVSGSKRVQRVRPTRSWSVALIQS